MRQDHSFTCLVATMLLTLTDAMTPRNAIVFDSPRPLLSGRLDPNISPGKVSQHEHRIIGGNAFNGVYDAVALRASTCTTLQPQSDKSSYWHPMVYKVVYDAATKKSQYAPMWGQTRIYYNFPNLKAGNGTGSYVEAFPDDFQMIAGNPGKKVGGRYLQEDLSIFYYCEQRASDGTITGSESYDLPKHGCSLLVTKVWFPSCWNGDAYDYANPFGHVKYPNLGGGLLGASCPLGYERRIPSILVETYILGASDFSDGPAGPYGSNGPDIPSYILANGDTTGYGLHADFANGWDTSILQRVVKECYTTDADLPTDKACPVLAPSWSVDTANSCLLSKQSKVPAEPVGWENYLDALPGCNLPWGPTGPKPTCSGSKDPSLVGWSRLVGREDNSEASLADIVRYGPVAGTASTSSGTSTAMPSATLATTTVAIQYNTTTTGALSPSKISSSATTSINSGSTTASKLASTTSKVTSTTSKASSTSIIPQTTSTKPVTTAKPVTTSSKATLAIGRTTRVAR